MDGTRKSDGSSLKFPAFDRRFFDSGENFTVIGDGELGGKASGLAFVRDILRQSLPGRLPPGVVVDIPRLTVITTSFFDEFMIGNGLDECIHGTMSDDQLAVRFQQADLPVMMLGDLRALIETVRQPLAVRSSSRLEDALYEPFAGIYATKMIPNNQFSPDDRFRRLVEAVKFVYASTFFRTARDYLAATRHDQGREKMAVIIQEVIGRRHGHRFYPDISGVARTYNFYPTGRARPEDGVVNLALGLGKTIVDGDPSWFYSPAWPRISPPYGSPTDTLRQTQLSFWSINMGRPVSFDPTRETEYLTHAHVGEAEADGTLRFVASTYDAAGDRIDPGLGGRGPRVITFAPILRLNLLPLNEVIRTVMGICRDALGEDVEIEFALTIDGKEADSRLRVGFLQVRPMVVSREDVGLGPSDLAGPRVVAASESVLGNGEQNELRDVVYIKPETFDPAQTTRIPPELDRINHQLRRLGRSCLLIGFGRWGTTDPWRGIPVRWNQISSARVIIESTLPEMNADLSQGSHFFHNITGFQVMYLSIRHGGRYGVDWAWLQRQPAVSETRFVRHVRLSEPLRVRVDGRRGRGVVLRATADRSDDGRGAAE